MTHDDTGYLMRRIARMREIRSLSDWELRSAVYRAHQRAVPVTDLAHAAELGIDRITEIVRTFDPQELPDPDEPELDWAYTCGGAVVLDSPQ